MQIKISKPPLWLINLTAFSVCVTLSLSLIYFYATGALKTNVLAQNKALRALPQASTLAENPFAKIFLVGRAAIVYDVSRNEIVFEQNAEAQLPLASLTKLMTAVVVAETLPQYTSIEILPRIQERDVKLKVGELWSLKDLLPYTLMTSSNTGADSMAAAVASYLGGKGTSDIEIRDGFSQLFVTKMNEKARELGLNQTYFLNPSGLDTDNNMSGAYGSAKDVVSLLSYTIKRHPNLLSATEHLNQTFIAPDGRKIEALNTNQNVVTIPRIIASKTGLTDLAGGNLAIAFDASFNEPFIVVILNSTQEERFKDIEKLITATINYLGSGLKGSVHINPDISYNSAQ